MGTPTPRAKKAPLLARPVGPFPPVGAAAWIDWCRGSPPARWATVEITTLATITGNLGGWIVKGMVKVGALRAGLAKKTVSVDGYTIHYYEGGKGPPLVLLHGLADDKSSFVGAAAKLTGRFRVILPDLPGHGDNARDGGRDYSILGQVRNLQAFFGAMGLTRFHLGGNSMGGHISLAYAIHHPDRVEKLILLNAPGFQVDDHEVYTGFGHHIETKTAFHTQVIDRVYYRRPKLPSPVVEYLIAHINREMDFINAMVRALKDGKDFILNDRVAGVQSRTLVLWGRHDVVVKPQVAEAYRDRIPNASLVWLENTAHSPQLEVADEVAEKISAFLAA